MQILIIFLVLLIITLLLGLHFSRQDINDLQARLDKISATSVATVSTNIPEANPWEVITPEKRYQLYIDSCKQIESYAQSISDSFEKAMITLSGGALGLSITFLGQVKGQMLEWVVLMPYSWICFGCSLVFMLWSYQVSRDSYDKQLFVLDRNYFDYAEEQNPLRERPQQIARFALGFFCIGLVLLSVFGFINAGNVMAEKKTTDKQTGQILETRGNPPRISPALGRPPKTDQSGNNTSSGNTQSSGSDGNTNQSGTGGQK